MLFQVCYRLASCSVNLKKHPSGLNLWALWKLRITHWHCGHGFLRQWLEKLCAVLGTFNPPGSDIFWQKWIKWKCYWNRKKSLQHLLTLKVSSPRWDVLVCEPLLRSFSDKTDARESLVVDQYTLCWYQCSVSSQVLNTHLYCYSAKKQTPMLKWGKWCSLPVSWGGFYIVSELMEYASGPQKALWKEFHNRIWFQELKFHLKNGVCRWKAHCYFLCVLSKYILG